MGARKSLAGLTVVSVEQAVAAPLCTARLADAGARVIKVERPEGDLARGYDGLAGGQSCYFVWLNRGKESLALDLKQGDELSFLRRMIGAADIYVQNLAPGAADRLGLGATELRKSFPRLITCGISGYGPGPWAQRKAYDLLVQAESGLASVTGTALEMARVGVSIADITCGLNAWGAILETLHARTHTGAGARIEISLFDALAELMSVPLLQFEGSGQLPQRLGLHHASIAPYGAYRCGDGQSLLLAIQNDREWLRFCTDILAAPDLSADPRFMTNRARVANRGDLDHIVLTALQRCAAPAWAARLESSRIAWGLVRDMAGLGTHPALTRMSLLTESGAISLPISPIRVDGLIRQPGPVPALGAQSMSLRYEFGDR